MFKFCSLLNAIVNAICIVLSTLFHTKHHYFDSRKKPVKFLALHKMHAVNSFIQLTSSIIKMKNYTLTPANKYK